MYKALIPVLLSTVAICSPMHALAAPKVVTSIKPLHSIVSAVMGSVGEPSVIVDRSGSPHDFALKPSQALALQNADLIVWVGHELETFLEKPLETIGSGVLAIELMDVDGLVKYEARDLETFGRSDEVHDEHGDHDKHEDHDDHDKHDDHKDHAEHDDHDKHEGHAHAHDGDDPHIWLDPANAKIIAGAVEKALSKIDPENASLYEKNTAAFSTNMDALIDEIAPNLKSLNGKSYLVMHDAFQYFEKRFGLKPIGAVTINPERKPGAAQIRKLQELAKSEGVGCAFTEPQFNAKPVETIAEGVDIKVTSIDPLGSDIDVGDKLYPAIIRNIANSFTSCLAR